MVLFEMLWSLDASGSDVAPVAGVTAWTQAVNMGTKKQSKSNLGQIHLFRWLFLARFLLGEINHLPRTQPNRYTTGS